MNIAFVDKTVGDVTFSRAELTRLNRFEFEKTLEGTGEKLEDFLNTEGCQRIPNMNRSGWEKLERLLSTDQNVREGFQAIASWIRVKRLIAE